MAARVLTAAEYHATIQIKLFFAQIRIRMQFLHCARRSGLYFNVSNVMLPSAWAASCWHFYIDIKAKGRKDEAVTEYSPLFEAAACRPTQGAAVTVKTAYCESRLTVRNRNALPVFFI